NSPVPPNRRNELLPLGYFPIDPDYKTSASLIPSEDETILEVQTSTGTIRKMRRLGTMEFTLKGQGLKLAAVIEVGARDANRISVLFTDLTTGTETYPGGRYIDLDRTPSGYYEVDFNRVDFPEDEYYARYLGFDDVGVFRALSRARREVWSDERVAALVDRKAARLEALERGGSILFPGAGDAVRRLAAELPLAIASGALK